MTKSPSQADSGHKHQHRFTYKNLASKKLGVLIILVCLIALILFNYTISDRIKFERQQDISDRLNLNGNMAVTVAQQVHGVLQQADQIATFAAYAYTKNKDILDLEEWANEKYIINPAFTIINIVDKNGDNVTSNIPIGSENYSHLEGFEKLKHQDSLKLHIGDPVIGKVTGKWRLPVFKRINNPDGSFAGAVIIAIDPFYLTNFFSAIGLNYDIFIELAGTDGVIRSRSINGELNMDTHNDITILSDFPIQRPINAFVYDGPAIGGKKMVMAYRTMNQYPLVITIATSYEQAISDSIHLAKQYRKIAIFTNLCIILISVLFIYLLIQNQRYITAHLKSRQKLEKKLSYAASHDNLTGLPNRTKFKKQFNLSLAAAKENNGFMAVLFVDLDNFKDINDTYGHALGDELLKQVAERLQLSVRTHSQDLVARLGGDEFALILNGISSPDNCINIADKILKAIRAPLKLDANTEVTISISIGAAVYPNNGSDYETLVNSADKAMYNSKQMGKDRFSSATT